MGVGFSHSDHADLVSEALYYGRDLSAVGEDEVDVELFGVGGQVEDEGYLAEEGQFFSEDVGVAAALVL